MIKGTTYVGHSILKEQVEETLHDAADCSHGTAIGSLYRRKSKVGPEELVGAVHEINLHLTPILVMSRQRYSVK